MIATAADYRKLARKRLPHFLYEYFDGAAFSGNTAKANEAAFNGVELPQNVLRMMPEIDTSCSVLSQNLSLPLMLSPVGLAGGACHMGEVLASKAAKNEGIALSLSTTSVRPLEEVAAISPPWFQLYVLRDRGLTERLIDHAAAQGCTKLVVTVDVPVLGKRWRDTYSGLAQPGLGGKVRRGGQILRRPLWLFKTGLLNPRLNLGTVARLLGNKNLPLNDCMTFINKELCRGVDVPTLQWIRAQWKGALIVKGVLNSTDAAVAIASGADAIIVSNHGGRQLDGVRSTAHALRGVASTVSRQVPLFVDGGIRTGLDIFRALALGADVAMIGRPWVFALAADGRRGVERVIALMREELKLAMALTGCSTIDEVKAIHVDFA